MPAEGRSQFQYAVVRVVPRVERGECVNAGVLVFCRSREYLAARVDVDEALLRALAPDLDVDLVGEHLRAVPRIAAGAPDAGPIAALEQAQRFHWLVAPSSTVVQTSEVHTGLCGGDESLDRLLDRLFAQLVTRPPSAPTV